MNKKHTEQMENITDITSNYFNKLTDKEILKTLARYDVLFTKHTLLTDAGNNLLNNKNSYLCKDISYLVIQSETTYSFLEKELKYLKMIYKRKSYRNFINEIETFKVVLKKWEKILDSLDLLIYYSKKRNITKEQKQK